MAYTGTDAIDWYLAADNVQRWSASIVSTCGLAISWCRSRIRLILAPLPPQSLISRRRKFFFSTEAPNNLYAVEWQRSYRVLSSCAILRTQKADHAAHFYRYKNFAASAVRTTTDWDVRLAARYEKLRTHVYSGQMENASHRSHDTFQCSVLHGVRISVRFHLYARLIIHFGVLS